MEHIEISGRIVCKFSGSMDTNTCMDIERQLTDLFEQHGLEGKKLPFEFDLAEVNYVASSFLRLCVKAAKSLGTGNVSVVKVAPGVKKVFKIAGFSELLRVD